MAGLLFALKKIIASLLLPPAILVLVGLIGLLLLRRSPRIARIMLWSMVISLLVMSLPVVERYSMRQLNMQPLTEPRAKTAQAILILGGGINRATPEYGDTLSRPSLERVRYGAVLARRLHLPVLVTGGQVNGGRAEADVMADVLQNEFAVPGSWIENRSQDTEDNLAFSAEIMRHHNVNTVLLVTSDFHMRRALQECNAIGVQCIAAPVTTYSVQGGRWIQELPNPGSFMQNALVLHEWLGLLAQRVH